MEKRLRQEAEAEKNELQAKYENKLVEKEKEMLVWLHGLVAAAAVVVRCLAVGIFSSLIYIISFLSFAFLERRLSYVWTSRIWNIGCKRLVCGTGCGTTDRVLVGGWVEGIFFIRIILWEMFLSKFPWSCRQWNFLTVTCPMRFYPIVADAVNWILGIVRTVDNFYWKNSNGRPWASDAVVVKSPQRLLVNGSI